MINVFANATLNHQTQVVGGVQSDASSALLQEFFRNKREENERQRRALHPLRDDAVRTADARFLDLPDYPWEPRYLSDLAVLGGLRMHFLDEGPEHADRVYLCLHGNPAWSYLYRKMIPVFLQAGHRVIAPDLVGFGKSDKPKRESAHSFSFHRQTLLELIERLDLQRIVLVVQDWGGILGLTLPLAMPERFAGLVVMNTMLATGDVALTPGFLAWREMCAKKPEFDIARLIARGNPGLSEAECLAYAAPFPDKGHRAATRAFPNLVPDHMESDGATVSRQARGYWQAQWRSPTLMAVGMKDPVFGPRDMETLHSLIHGCPAPMAFAEEGHFLPEVGTHLAQAALRFLDVP